MILLFLKKQTNGLFSDCACVTPLLTRIGTNPRGLCVNKVWLMGVTHVSSFGTLKYVHVSIDTCSKFFVASVHKGEKGRHVIKHVLQAIATLGVPEVVKTDNGSAYVSQSMKSFFHSGIMQREIFFF